MSDRPFIADSQAFARWRATPDLWRPVVRDIARAANVPAGEPIPFRTGTNLVVDLDGRAVLKLFPHLDAGQFVSERATLRRLHDQRSGNFVRCTKSHPPERGRFGG
ncbi:hypothetical protein VQ03_23150 [Methylobacterium tarhaniae]|uniref:Uncharacterized protein n=1 Tax=Methylobacterium tarhaniae TaxID=1187852 RepID=A0A0J6SHI3_9HYPH|nr:hypothetical protein [Methylobacterium tarhaniae]KMO34690.1 hypothetical protein VQ03_23150 [Methylobacterium tarhaniae]